MKRWKIRIFWEDFYSKEKLYLHHYMKKTGDKGEIVAIRYLQKNGYSIRDTNFKFWRFWEIDIIAQKGDRTYFFEVKYRKNLWYGTPEEAIIYQKLKKCRKTLEFYCKKHSISFESIQFDVITILKQVSSYRVSHYKNIEI